jgi:hypothetical protein
LAVAKVEMMKVDIKWQYMQTVIPAEAGIYGYQGFPNPNFLLSRGQTLLGDIVFFYLALKLWSAD